MRIVITVVVLCDQVSGAVVKPQIRVDRNSRTGLVRIAVHDDQRFRVERKLDI